MTRTARLTLGDQTIELPVTEGTEGELALDISSLRAKTGLITFDPGFGTTAFCTSAITYSDGENGILRYRGIPIEQLAEQSSFVETAFLLIHGRLPSRGELDQFRAQGWPRAPCLHESYKHHFDGFPVDAPPMAMLSAMINTLACFYPQLNSAREEDFDEEAVWLLSKSPTIAASSYRRSLGLPFMYPDPALPYANNFLHMMFSQPLEEYVASEEIARALNLVWILHADHELGCSTTTVRIVGSSRANLFASCAAGVCSLWGPVHGGATIAVVEMLEAIHRGDLTIDQALARARDRSSGFRLKGFGHRIYKTFDPRAVILKNAAAEAARSPRQNRPAPGRCARARGPCAQGLLFHRSQALPQRRLLRWHHDAHHRHPQDDVHGDVRDRPDARLDRPLERAARRSERPDHPAQAGLRRTDERPRMCRSKSGENESSGEIESSASSLDDRALSLVGSHELSLVQDVSLHGGLQFGLGCAGSQVHRRPQGIQLEEVTVRFALGRRWTAVAEVAEVVLALLRPGRERCRRRHALLQFTGLGRQVEENPVDPGSTGSVGVIARSGRGSWSRPAARTSARAATCPHHRPCTVLEWSFPAETPCW